VRLRITIIVSITFFAAFATAQNFDVTGSVNVTEHGQKVSDQSGAVVQLTPVDGDVVQAPPRTARMTQKDKRFEPHLIVIPVGSSVEFPNKDPFFHNVFSVYQGTKFDLGLYEAGTTKTVRFARPGPSFIFCNVHPEMSAVIFSVKSPYYAVTGPNGTFSINVPSGEYKVTVWFERARADDLQQLTSTIKVNGVTRVPAFAIAESPSLASNHKNKYGRDYDHDHPSGYKVP
jgi:plastocyanin